MGSFGHGSCYNNHFVAKVDRTGLMRAPSNLDAHNPRPPNVPLLRAL